mgnify:CR=1 FL=1
MHRYLSFSGLILETFITLRIYIEIQNSIDRGYVFNPQPADFSKPHSRIEGFTHPGPRL